MDNNCTHKNVNTAKSVIFYYSMLMCSVAIKYACFEHSIFFKVKLSKLKKNVTSMKRNIEFRNNQYGLGSEDSEYELP